MIRVKKDYLLEAIVFICGGVVMVFELIGSRLIGPYVGTSIYAWTSLIGVILASLSLGYYFGGRLADKNPNRNFLGTIIAFSGVLIYLTVFFENGGLLSINMFSSLELRSVIISIILFAPASFFLGMVSPYAARLRVNNLETVGRDVGRLYALSTVGSIFGTFLAGFYIIPNFGTKASLFIIAASLMVASILLVGKKFVRDQAMLISIVMFIFLVVFNHFAEPIFSAFVIADIDTQYNRIRIYNGTDLATGKSTINFSTDPFGTQGAVFSDNTGDLVFEYTKFFRLAGYFNPKIESALMIGGCIYTYPRDFIKNFPEARMDIVEIDPAMTQIAKDYFYFNDSPAFSFFYQDGRIFLNDNKREYDVIFNDAFNSSSSVPFQLATKEAIQKEFDALNDDGVVLSNIISSAEGEQGKFFRAEYATYKKVFPQVFVFLVSDETSPEKRQNIIIVASKSKKVFDFKAASEELNEYLGHLWNPIKGDTLVLTDDFAPVEYYQRR